MVWLGVSLSFHNTCFLLFLTLVS
uniref:Uncharacterized protein n=1 Tax=Arundo donax TaxID=35708 RepID=A0A0A8Z121_ARUDO